MLRLCVTNSRCSISVELLKCKRKDHSVQKQEVSLNSGQTLAECPWGSPFTYLDLCFLIY